MLPPIVFARLTIRIQERSMTLRQGLVEDMTNDTKFGNKTWREERNIYKHGKVDETMEGLYNAA